MDNGMDDSVKVILNDIRNFLNNGGTLAIATKALNNASNYGVYVTKLWTRIDDLNAINHAKYIIARLVNAKIYET